MLCKGNAAGKERRNGDTSYRDAKGSVRKCWRSEGNEKKAVGELGRDFRQKSKYSLEVYSWDGKRPWFLSVRQSNGRKVSEMGGDLRVLPQQHRIPAHSL